MKLYQCPDASLADSQSQPEIETPLGTVLFEARIGAFSTTSVPISAVYQLPNDAKLLCWWQPEFDLEMLICQPKFDRIANASVDNCWAVMWRMKAMIDTPLILFLSSWEANYTWVKGGPDSGEYLYAKTWEDNDWRVSVGTEDATALIKRAQRGDHLPKVWQKEVLKHFERDRIHYEYMENGIPVPLPEMNAGDFIQIQFSIFWERQEGEDLFPSNVLEPFPHEILNGAIAYL